MSVPLVYNRKWNRATYYAMRKFTRWLWHTNKMDQKVSQALLNAAMHGHGYIKVDRP